MSVLQALAPALPAHQRLPLQPPSLAACSDHPVSCLLASKCVPSSPHTACKATSELPLPGGRGGASVCRGDSHGQREVLQILLPLVASSLVSKSSWGSSEYASVLQFLYSWLQGTLPACGSHLLAVVQPSLQLAWTHTNATVSFLSARFGDSLAGFLQRVSWR